MKRSLEHTLFGLGGLIILLLIVGGLFIKLRTGQVATDDSECSKLSVIQLDSERAQGILIKDRRVLAVKLSNEANYSVPGGHVELGESKEDALRRELAEEIGIESNVNSYKYYKTSCQPKGSKQQRVIYYKVGSWEDDISLAHLGDKIKWVDSSYESKKKADADLKLVLYWLKNEGLID